MATHAWLQNQFSFSPEDTRFSLNQLSRCFSSFKTTFTACKQVLYHDILRKRERESAQHSSSPFTLLFLVQTILHGNDCIISPWLKSHVNKVVNLNALKRFPYAPSAPTTLIFLIFTLFFKT